ncbi:cytochrome C oxidase subunit IV family protein [Bordetella petrii]|uniref:cytochrome C oxidase subunit IV family protein n=1 Tax=Bordetella petrii TaxID=94624 RepID=UPI001E5CAC1F|nr:cytochrome C oxidase subunit IV family protein [Bordetella petrii]MCD0501388.1 cytochrome C oxidase subunit IV family protein [Bordetella petrii]
MTRLFWCWVGLVLLTAATVAVAGGAGGEPARAVIAVLAVVKAWLIIDGFMELRHAPRGWYLLLLAWPVAIALGIGLAAALGP